MRVVFVADKPDLNRGSYRIWVRDAAEALADVGLDVDVTSTAKFGGLQPGTDVLIFDKGCRPPIEFAGHRPPKIGVINPSAAIAGADFAIVGSVEEQLSLIGLFPQIFVWPLVERQFENAPRRVHVDSETLTVCFHGGSGHLGSMASSGLCAALERFKDRLAMDGRKLLLRVISQSERPAWRIGRPRVPTEFIRYDYASVGAAIQEADIGLAPNATFRAPGGLSSAFLKRWLKLDANSTDYVMRFKTKSNYGRALVFQQLGIPVIADITPSHMDLIRHGENGYLAANEASWLDGLTLLADAAHRNEITSRGTPYSTQDVARRFARQLVN